MKIKLTLTGEREIDSVLQGLKPLYNHRILQAAHADAAKPMIDRIKQLAPSKSGKTVKSIGVTKPSMSRSSMIGEVIVGPRRGRFGGRVAHLLEFGTNPRVNKSGAYRGYVSKTPFVEPGFVQTNSQVIERIRVALAQKTLAFMKRIIKKNG